MKKKILTFTFILFFSIRLYSLPPTDSDRLGMAMEYFQSKKYLEALLIFEQLEEKYQLNPRFIGYMGVCYFNLWNYEKACKYLDSTISQLDKFAPHERAIYYYADANGHFNLKQYKEAIPLYERLLNVCYNNEKPNTFYQLGICYMFLEDWENACDYFYSALAYYYRFSNTSDQQAHVEQIKNMIKGCEERMSKDKSIEKEGLPRLSCLII